MLPVYRFDSVSRIHWLEFDGKPEQITIDLLKREGWRWSGYRKQWHTNRRFARVPAGIEYEDGGECDYSSERPDRLKAAAERADGRAEAAYERSNGLVSGIPLGQPVITGGRGGHAQEKAVEQSRRAMEVSQSESEKAEHLAYKARSSAAHQARKERPDVIHRRIKRLRGEITTLKNNFAQHVRWLAYDVKEQEISEQDAKARIEGAKAAMNERIALLEVEIAGNEQALQETGGLLAGRLDIQVGTVINGGWRGACRVKKVNKRKGIIMSYTCERLKEMGARYNHYVIPVDDVFGLIEKADGTPVEQPAHKTRPPVLPEPEEHRVFAVETVETVEVSSHGTSLFPTPPALAAQLASNIPDGAYLILEPSAGTGVLARAAHSHMAGRSHAIHCCEILPELRSSLEQQGFTVVASDFLAYDLLQYDCVIANPPFHGTEWVEHVEHMLELLKPGGTLLAILPAGFAFREDKRIKAFRELVETHGWWQHLPEDAFVESGTRVKTVMVSVVKPEDQK